MGQCKSFNLNILDTQFFVSDIKNMGNVFPQESGKHDFDSKYVYLAYSKAGQYLLFPSFLIAYRNVSSLVHQSRRPRNAVMMQWQKKVKLTCSGLSPNGRRPAPAFPAIGGSTGWGGGTARLAVLISLLSSADSQLGLSSGVWQESCHRWRCLIPGI